MFNETRRRGPKVRCRHNFAVELPCNFVKEGFCGIDARPCRIEELVEE